MLRPAVPSSPIAGCANAAVLNHCSISSSRGRPLSSFGSPMMSARSFVSPSKLRSRPDDDRQRRAALQRDDRSRSSSRSSSALTIAFESVEVVELPDAGEHEAVRAVGRRAPALEIDPVRVLHGRQAAALVVDVLEGLAEGVVGLGREARCRAARR